MWPVVVVLATLVLVVGINAGTAPVLQCDTDRNVTGVFDCSYYAEIADAVLVNGTDSNTTVTVTGGTDRFLAGTTRIGWFASNQWGNSSCTVTINVTFAVPTVNGTAVCGYGSCSGTYPYSCECPPGTSGAYCCPTLPDNTTCGGAHHGACAPAAKCDCLTGYGGSFCCPLSSNGTGSLCGGNGCCMSTGRCKCTGFNSTGDTACDLPVIPPPSGSALTTVAIALIAVGATLVVGVPIAYEAFKFLVAPARQVGAAEMTPMLSR